MSKIDFPPGNQSPFIDKDGRQWDYINRSWVKKFEWVEETPLVDDDKEYARFNGNWREITYPIPSDVSEEDGDDGIKSYVRSGDSWAEVALGAVGFSDAPNDGSSYVRNSAAWVLSPNDDLTTNYYTKEEIDTNQALAIHQHTYDDGNLLGFGTLAGIDDAVEDGKSYLRNNGIWVPLENELPAAQSQSNSITIIDPIASDDALILFTPVALTVSAIQSAALAVGGGASVRYNVYHSTSADGSTGIFKLFNTNKVSNTNAGQEDIPDNPIIPVDSWIWLEIVDPPVNTEFFHITLLYTEN